MPSNTATNDSGLLSVLADVLGHDGVERLSTRIGADRDSTERALAAALPALVGGLAREAEGTGSASLDTALAEDHDGSLLDNLGALFGGGGVPSTASSAQPQGGGAGIFGNRNDRVAGSRATNGDGILRHVLGAKRAPVEAGIGRASGLGGAQVSQLLTMVAPLVMGALGRLKSRRNLGQNEVAGLLRDERKSVEQQTPAGRFAGLREMLDADDDGQISDEVAKIGAALGGAFLLGKLRHADVRVGR